MRDSYDSILTEKRNPRTVGIDRLTTLEAVKLINSENRAVDDAMDAAAESIAAAVDIIAERMSAGGCLVYVGAGTSGRLGVIDAAECPPTFGVAPDLVRGIIAGGNGAMFRSVEGAEDSFEGGAAAVDADGITSADAVVGISASGRAPFVLGALDRAKKLGAAVIGVNCNPGSPMGEPGVCDVCVTAYTGPEVIAGSTRLKAGTATKLILNIFSTCAMIKTGRVMSNLMVNVVPSNEKLIERATRLIMTLAGCDEAAAREALAKHGNVREAAEALRSGAI
ncbi:MAG: N-acetylmuramic acid 6-phosphate etherase [Clostridia bacterium]|nr:N-acetylmuramic acid 6-phosphate etherase [Clostridia bacterium]